LGISKLFIPYSANKPAKSVGWIYSSHFGPQGPILTRIFLRTIMTTVYDVDAGALIGAASKELKGKVKAPEWTEFVKTGVSKERPPEDPDWWYVREASILRKIYVKGPIGVSRLRKEYRAKKNRGVRCERSYVAGGKIIRLACQQLEECGYVKKAKDSDGREITAEGMKFLDAMSYKVKGA